ncbi:MAG: DUF6062 family protein [Chloroflexota bacterium]
MPDLPVRDMSGVDLARLLDTPGCPGCHQRAKVVDRYVEAFLYESVNSVGFRADLDAARGLCGEHVQVMLRVDRRTSGGMLGPAILLDAILRVREAELRGVVAAPRPLRSRRAREAARPADCPVCREASSGVASALRRLVAMTEDPAWAEAVADADVCLEHLVAMMGAPDRPAGWALVERRQLERLGELRRRLIAHADHAAHDRRHLATADERAAVDEAARLLRGGEA